MRSLARRFGIAGLAATLIGGALTSTQAGIIPWAYDAIFGPNYYGGYSASYGPAPMSYSAGYAPYSPCGPGGCGVPYAASSCNTCAPCSPCSTGTCTPRVSYCAPCEVACNSTCTPQTTWKSAQPTPATPKAEVGTKVRINNGNSGEPDLENPRGNRQYPPLESELKKPIQESESVPVEPRSNSNGDAGFGPTNKSESGQGTFQPPKGSTDTDTSKSKKSGPTFGDLDAQASRRPLNLDNKSTWSLSSNLPQQRAVATQSRFGEAKIARRPSNVKADPATVASGNAVVRK